MGTESERIQRELEEAEREFEQAHKAFVERGEAIQRKYEAEVESAWEEHLNNLKSNWALFAKAKISFLGKETSPSRRTAILFYERLRRNKGQFREWFFHKYFCNPNNGFDVAISRYLSFEGSLDLTKYFFELDHLDLGSWSPMSVIDFKKDGFQIRPLGSKIGFRTLDFPSEKLTLSFDLEVATSEGQLRELMMRSAEPLFRELQDRKVGAVILDKEASGQNSNELRYINLVLWDTPQEERGAAASLLNYRTADGESFASPSMISKAPGKAQKDIDYPPRQLIWGLSSTK